MHGYIKRNYFSKDKAHWTLMDWGGQLAKTYGLPDRCCNVLVFGPDGRLLLRTGGREIDPAAVSAVIAAVAAATPFKAEAGNTP